MNKPLRTCRECDLEAHTEEDLFLFVSHKKSKHGKENFCRKCHSKRGSQWQHDNPDKANASTAKWTKNNPDKNAAKAARYRASKFNATPAWADYEIINDFYLEAQYHGMEVDHIVPLQHELVCGLHVEHNLQLLTKEQNCSKHNFFEVA